jgi:hypothetical protein
MHKGAAYELEAEDVISLLPYMYFYRVFMLPPSPESQTSPERKRVRVEEPKEEGSKS